MFAIINDRGRQYKVEQGEIIRVDRTDLSEGSKIQFDKVLFVDGKIGTPYVDGASVSGVKQFGSHRSPFITVLLQDPLHKKEIKLTPAEWQALVTWVDANAPYHDTFYSRRPPGGGAPVRNIRVELPDPFAAGRGHTY